MKIYQLLPGITVPTLIINALKMLTPPEMERRMAKPYECHFVELPGFGHLDTKPGQTSTSSVPEGDTINGLSLLSAVSPLSRFC